MVMTMTKRYRSLVPTSNQDLRHGIRLRNGSYFVDEGYDDLFRSLPPIQRGLAKGQIVEVIEEDLSAELPTPEVTYLNLKEAAEIGEVYGWTKDQLTKSLKNGDLPGYEGKGKYKVPEAELLYFLMEHSRSQVEEPADPISSGSDKAAGWDAPDDDDGEE
jgi:hypothetical protein